MIASPKNCYVSLAAAHAFRSTKCTRNHCVTLLRSLFRQRGDTSEASCQDLPWFAIASCSLLNEPQLEVRSLNPVGPKNLLCSSVPGGTECMNTREFSGFRDLQTSTRSNPKAFSQADRLRSATQSKHSREHPRSDKKHSSVILASPGVTPL